MKTLTTEQQQELITFLNNIHDTGFPDIEADAAYWATELKPKRIRRSRAEIEDEKHLGCKNYPNCDISGCGEIND